MKTSKVQVIEYLIEIVIPAMGMMLICLSMTVFADSLGWIENLLYFVMFICIAYGIFASSINFNHIDKTVILLTVLFFIIRLISYKHNDLTITYGGTFMLQAFYLIGISRFLFRGKKSVLSVLYSFLTFDMLAIAFCYYRFFFKYEDVAVIVEKYASNGMEPQTSLFQNPNYAGLMSGAAVIICFALIMNRGVINKKSILHILVILTNVLFLFANTGCRSAQTGLMVTFLALIGVVTIKGADSIRRIIGTMLLMCFIALIPLYALVYWGNNNLQLDNVSNVEQTIDAVSSGRYAIWKTTVLSMKGHELFGYGNSTTAWDMRKELVKKTPAERKSKEYVDSANHKRQHSGYLAVYNEAGILGIFSLLILLLNRIKKLKGRFRDGQWEKLLLIYIFWINLFEAKFVLHVFFTGFLMMVLLLPPEEEQSNQLEKAV